ncbi:MAG TPA: FAD-dependent oxidoreductase [Acidobacteriaceae bacterium]
MVDTEQFAGSVAGETRFEQGWEQGASGQDASPAPEVCVRVEPPAPGAGPHPAAGPAMRHVRFLILGCGPCGLGAALELEENGAAGPDHYLVVDPSPVPGGWASSRQTPEGFTFDFGGHVLFPHKYYPKFMELLDSLPMQWVASVPKRGVSLDGHFLPYPAQRNLQRLGPRKLILVLTSLLLRRLRRGGAADPGEDHKPDLESYLMKQFGEYLTETLMGPLNSKMWAHATSALSNQWVTLRSGSSGRNVPDVSLRQTMRNLLTQQDTPGWTSDTFVTYPATGGSGEIWRAIAAKLPPERLLLGRGLRSLALEQKIATLDNGEQIHFDRMISSMPLDTLLRSIEGRPDLHAQAARFVFARSRLYGFGIEGEIAPRYRALHSFHVPNQDIPFWRVNFPGSVSAGNVPAEVGGRPCHSVLCEVSEPASKPGMEESELGRQVEAGLEKLGLLGKGRAIVSRFHQTIEHGYPVPFLGRDALLSEVQPVLEAAGVYSRGRFGAWKYEISNQDHAFMQGVEVVRRLLFKVPEKTYTDPYRVNELVEEETGASAEVAARTASGTALDSLRASASLG